MTPFYRIERTYRFVTIVGDRIYCDYSIGLIFVRLLMRGVILCRDCCLLWLIDRLFVVALCALAFGPRKEARGTNPARMMVVPFWRSA